MRAPENWRARGARERAIREPSRRRAVDSNASLRSVCETFYNDAIESTVRRRAGSRVALARSMRAPVFWRARGARD
eukprot:1284386-Lingulodinium_polyedra.AAC.1